MKKIKNFLSVCILCYMMSITFLLVGCQTANNSDSSVSASSGNAPQEYDEKYLDYELNDNGSSYTVIGRGKCTRAVLTIPDRYEGKPVTSIGESAFMRDETLTELIIGSSVTVINSYAFNGCSNLKRVVVGNGVKELKGNSFEDCTSLEYVVLGDSVNKISWHVFKNCGNLESVVIGPSIRTIIYDWFVYCYNLREVFYKGTETQWNQIDNKSNSVALAMATVYYYSETQPIEEGNYWYLSDGIVTKWSIASDK